MTEDDQQAAFGSITAIIFFIIMINARLLLCYYIRNEDNHLV